MTSRMSGSMRAAACSENKSGSSSDIAEPTVVRSTSGSRTEGTYTNMPPQKGLNSGFLHTTRCKARIQLLTEKSKSKFQCSFKQQEQQKSNTDMLQTQVDILKQLASSFQVFQTKITLTADL